MKPRPTSTFKNFLFVALSLAMAAPVMLVGCGSDKPDDMDLGPGPSLAAPRDGVFLRASFDDNPARLLGRFVPDNIDTSEVDETDGFQTSCSQFIDIQEVRAAGSYDEYYNASTDVMGSFGVDPGVAGGPGGSAEGGFQRGTEMRVSYQLTRKLVTEINDIDGFNRCCESAVNNCAEFFIGEFWAGTGTIYSNTGRQITGTAQGSGAPNLSTVATQVGGEVDVADGWVWRRETSFDDLYFAFRINRAIAEDTCAWFNRPPQSSEGRYFPAASPMAASVDLARTYAMRNARTAVVQYMGEAIRSEFQTRYNLDGYFEDEGVVAAAAEGIASRVHADRWCPEIETIDTPEGQRFIVRVLAYVPNEEMERAEREVLETIAERSGDPEFQEEVRD